MIGRIRRLRKPVLKVLSWVASLFLVANFVAPTIFPQQNQNRSQGQAHTQLFADRINPDQRDIAIFLGIVLVAIMLWRIRVVWRHLNLKSVLPYSAIFTAALVGIFGVTGILVSTGILLGAMLSIFALFMLAALEGGYAQEELLSEVRFVARGASNIKAYDTWDQLQLCKIIGTAKKSIEVIDSNCGEHYFWAERAKEALKNGASGLTLSVYMLDPSGIFGAQRLLEMPKSQSEKKVLPNRRSATAETIEHYQKKFRERFIENCTNFCLALQPIREQNPGKTVSLEIYHYPTMPCLRAVIVDGAKYIFGWFPLNDLNPCHACFFLDGTSSLTESDRAAIKCLENHIKEIKEDRRPVNLDNDVTAESLKEATA